jgi:hypothetical protein
MGCRDGPKEEGRALVGGVKDIRDEALVADDTVDACR